MTSLKQIEANRRNAGKSTGPLTEEGKARSRCNAVRHGLTAETVIGALEDADDYKAFELSVTSDFDAQTAVERELVLRLASLLWRLRRATAIETGLIANAITTRGDPDDLLDNSSFEPDHLTLGERRQGCVNAELAARYLRLAFFDNGAIERLSRYEAALWRQVGQLLMTLEWLQRRAISG